MKEYKILGLKVQTVSEQDAKAALHNFLNSSQAHQIVTVNPEFIVTAQKNKRFLEVINRASLATIDGTGIIKALEFQGHRVSLEQRLTGVRLSRIIISLAEQHNKKIIFCLSSTGLTQPDKLANKLGKDYPHLNFQTADEKNVLEKIKTFSPEIILVGFGAPQQDLWITDHLNLMPSVRVAIGVGGTFDFLSGRIKRAPKFLRSLGLEWFWRFIRQPWRFRRIFRAIIIFPYLILKDRLIKHKDYDQN